jgi:hypothetical protein
MAGGRGSCRHDASWRPRPLGLAFAAAALAPVLLFAVLLPEGGWELFEPLLFWPILAGVVLVALVLWRVGGGLAPPTRRMLTLGTLLYALVDGGPRTPSRRPARRHRRWAAWRHRRMSGSALSEDERLGVVEERVRSIWSVLVLTRPALRLLAGRVASRWVR